MNIRKATIDDIDILIKLDIQCFNTSAYDYNTWVYFFSICKIYVCTLSDKTITGVIVTSIVNDNSKIQMSIGEKSFYDYYKLNSFKVIVSICVDEKYRKKGVGSLLLKHVIKKSNGYLVLSVRENHEQSINFYLKNKFKLSKFININYYDNPQDNAVIMYMHLKQKKYKNTVF
jgi:ribosomal protein S18 acetylase RimI-like enzyme